MLLKAHRSSYALANLVCVHHSGSSRLVGAHCLSSDLRQLRRCVGQLWGHGPVYLFENRIATIDGVRYMFPALVINLGFVVQVPPHADRLVFQAEHSSLDARTFVEHLYKSRS
jgi:hypothetical protein